MFKVSIVLLLIVAFAVASDIAAFGKCMKTCRKNKQAFRFCLSYCKPSKNETIAVVPAVEKEAVADEQEADSQFGTVPDSKDLWKKYRQVLMDFLRQGNADLFPGLQLVPQPFAADWDEDERILTNLCNRLPKPGQAYEQSVYELTNEYGDFITNIIVPDDKPVDRTKFDAARREIRTIENRINDAEMECADQFDARTARRRSPSLPPIEPFDLYSIRYCKDIEEARRDLTNVLYNYEILKRSEYGEHFRLKDSVVKFSETRDKKFVAFGSLARFVAAMKENRGNSFEVKINQSTRTSSEKTSSMNIDVGFKNDFITVGAGYQSTSMKLSTSFKEFVLIVGAASYKYIPVFPDRTWFSPEVIYKYGRYPMRNAKNYFGGAGTMPLIPKGFIVAAGPKVTMLLNAEDTSKMEKTSQLKLNLNVAGFDFAFGKNAGMKKSQESANLFRVELNGNSFEPLILAVDNQVNELLINQGK